MVQDAPGAGTDAVVRFCSPGPTPRLRRRDEALLERAETLTLDVEGERVCAYAWGEGAPVLLVHGWASCAAHLGAFVDPLIGAGRRVVAPDMPAHGRSTGTLSSFYKFEQTLWRLRPLVGGPAAVIAHSGGAVATTMAVRNGLDVQRVVYLAPMVRLERGAARFAAASALSPDQARAFEGEMRARFGRDLWERTAVDLLIRGMHLRALLIHDRDDPEVDHDEVARLVEVWPEAELVTTTGLGHHRILRDTDTVARALTFLTAGTFRLKQR